MKRIEIHHENGEITHIHHITRNEKHTHHSELNYDENRRGAAK